MKKLLALVLVVAMLASFAACKKEKNQEEDLKDYLQNDEVVNFETLKSGETYTFDHLDSETVTITSYEGSNVKHKLAIPDTLGGKRVVGISTGAFKANNDITQVIIPNTVTTIGSYAFAQCALITDVTVPESVTAIGECAFTHCTSLKNVNIKSTQITEYANMLFYGCTSLTSITVPASIEKVGTAAFYGCTSVTEIVVEEGVKEIGAQAFQNCEKLEKVTLPASLTKIGDMAFSGSKALYADGLTLAEGATVAEAYFAMEIYELPERPVEEPEEPEDPEGPEDPDEPEDETPITLPEGWVMLDNGVIAFGHPGDWTVATEDSTITAKDPMNQHTVTVVKSEKKDFYSRLTEDSFDELVVKPMLGEFSVKVFTIEQAENANGIAYTKIAMTSTASASVLKTIIAYTNSVNTYLITVDSTAATIPELVDVIVSTLVRTA